MNFNQLWQDLGNITVDQDDCIEQEFLHFPIGSNKFEIWSWFESAWNLSVAQLMGMTA